MIESDPNRPWVRKLSSVHRSPSGDAHRWGSHGFNQHGFDYRPPPTPVGASTIYSGVRSDRSRGATWGTRTNRWGYGR